MMMITFFLWPFPKTRARYIAWRLTRATLKALIAVITREIGWKPSAEQEAKILIHFSHWVIAHHATEFRMELAPTRLIYLYLQTQPWERFLDGPVEPKDRLR